MAATPLNKHKRPKALVSCAMPSKSTRTIDVRAIKAAVNQIRETNYKAVTIELDNALSHIQEKSPNIPAVMQNPM